MTNVLTFWKGRHTKYWKTLELCGNGGKRTPMEDTDIFLYCIWLEGLILAVFSDLIPARSNSSSSLLYKLAAFSSFYSGSQGLVKVCRSYLFFPSFFFLFSSFKIVPLFCVQKIVESYVRTRKRNTILREKVFKTSRNPYILH